MMCPKCGKLYQGSKCTFCENEIAGMTPKNVGSNVISSNMRTSNGATMQNRNIGQNSPVHNNSRQLSQNVSAKKHVNLWGLFGFIVGIACFLVTLFMILFNHESSTHMDSEELLVGCIITLICGCLSAVASGIGVAKFNYSVHIGRALCIAGVIASVACVVAAAVGIVISM